MTSAEMLARFKLLAQRPATDEAWSDANIYLLLGEAQSQINQELAMHVPHANVIAPELITTTDNGLTYLTSADVVAALEVYPDRNATIPLQPGPYTDDGSEYVFEAPRTIRMIGRSARTFSGGPYARYVPATGALNASTAPTIEPAAVHICVVYRALQEYASAGGGIHNPSIWMEREQRVLWGDPNQPGSVGIIPGLKAQVAATGRGGGGVWWTRFRSPVT